MKTALKFCFAALLFLACTSCRQKEVVITKDYVVNPHWDKADNSFEVTRMKMKGNNSLDFKSISDTGLLNTLVPDSTFSYITNVTYNGNGYAERKVYFDRYSGFLWGDLNDRHSPSNKKVLGALQPETWYLLGGLGEEKTLYYVYIDSLNNFHSYKVPASSWTNY